MTKSLIPRYSLSTTISDLINIYSYIICSLYKKGNLDIRVENCRFVFTYNGRTALRIILRTLGFNQGDTVIVPGITCRSVHDAIIAEGGTPVFIGIKGNEFMPTIEEYVSAMDRYSSKYVIAISYWGYPYDIDKLRNALSDDVKIIQDCALSYNSYRNGKQDGFNADAAFYSYCAGKPLFLYGGGSYIFKDVNNYGKATELNFATKRKYSLFWESTRLYFKSKIFNNAYLYSMFRKRYEINNIDNDFKSANVHYINENLPWLKSFFKKYKSRMISEIKLREKKHNLLQTLLHEAGLNTISGECNVDWNYWMSPIILPNKVYVSSICSELCKYGYEVIQPYLAETLRYKKSVHNVHTVPNLIIGPSLDYMSEEKIYKFIELLKKLINVSIQHEK